MVISSESDHIPCWFVTSSVYNHQRYFLSILVDSTPILCHFSSILAQFFTNSLWILFVSCTFLFFLGIIFSQLLPILPQLFPILCEFFLNSFSFLEIFLSILGHSFPILAPFLINSWPILQQFFSNIIYLVFLNLPILGNFTPILSQFFPFILSIFSTCVPFFDPWLFPILAHFYPISTPFSPNSHQIVGTSPHHISKIALFTSFLATSGRAAPLLTPDSCSPQFQLHSELCSENVPVPQVSWIPIQSGSKNYIKSQVKRDQSDKSNWIKRGRSPVIWIHEILQVDSYSLVYVSMSKSLSTSGLCHVQFYWYSCNTPVS